jgi:3-oxoacyl-(acyl-carrier-protein) synthase
VTVANACSSGADALGLAKGWIEAGLCDLAIAGGADELTRITYIGFAHLLITSAAPCRPFDKSRSGLNLGEGAGIVVLESEEALRRRGGHALAWLAGYGTCNDAHHPTAPHPEGVGLRRAIETALRDAGIAPSDVGVINAHGTSTLDNDRVEGRVLSDIFGAEVPAVSTKAHTGHTLGAAGGIEAVLSVQSLLDGTVPATVGHETPDPECGLRPTTRRTEHTARWALSDSLAFGGGNCALIFERGD